MINLKCNQYNVKVFEVNLDDTKTFLQFLETNRVLLAHHLLLIQGEAEPSIIEYLNEYNLHYIFNMQLPAIKRSIKKFKMLISEDEASVPKEIENINKIQEKKKDIRDDNSDIEQKSPLKVIDNSIRSGQSIDYDGDLIITSRINSGAKVATLGSLITLGVVEGFISSVGEFIIVPATKRGTILFHGKKIENDFLKFSLNKISFSKGKILIQPIKSIKGA